MRSQKDGSFSSNSWERVLFGRNRVSNGGIMRAPGTSPWFFFFFLTEWVEQEPEVSGGRASVEELMAAV